MALTLNLGPATPGLFENALSISATFAQGLAAYQMALVTDYLFGTGAAGSAPVIPITNLTDLATYFNPQADAVGTAVQNEEVERFQAFNTTNHAFTTNALQLTAALDAGGGFNVITLTLVGAVTGTTVLTFAATTGVIDGMMIASTGSQAIASGTKVVSHDGTTVTLNAAVTLANSSPVQFLPIYPCSGVTAGSNATLTFSGGVPAQVVAGMYYTNINDGTFGTRKVLSTTSNTVTLDGSVTVSSNAQIWFQPPVTSGQMWTKVGYQPGHNGANVIGMELTCTIPANTAQGAWPAWWLYSKTTDGFTFDSSEIDMFEFFYGTTSTSSAFTSNIHGGFYQDSGAYFKLYSSGSAHSRWDTFGFFRNLVDYSLTSHKFQMIWTPDKVYRYIDGQLTIVNSYLWSSNCTAQMGLDLACGSFLPSFLATNFYPQSTAQFPFMYSINEIKIWQA